MYSSESVRTGGGGTALFGFNTSVRKVVSRSKFTEQIFTPQTEQNFQMRAQIILLL